MSWRLAFHSTKLLFSYLVPYKVKLFRDAIFASNIGRIRELVVERPRLLQQAIDADGNTALGLAILLAETDVVKTLLELGSDPNIGNAFDGNHPLVFLAKLRTEENSKTAVLAEILLKAGSNPLHEIRYQADCANRMDATQTPSFHETPLLCCVRFQNEDVLKKCIENNIDINALNPETGTSPLMLASALGYINICNLLIDAGADINACDHSGNTPLHLTVQGYGKKIPIIDTLLKHGADVNAINEDGFTPLLLAKRMDNDECFKILESNANEKILPPAYQQVEDFDNEKQQQKFEGVKQEEKDQNLFSFT